MISSLFCVILSYFSYYPNDANNAIKFICDNKEEFSQSLHKFSGKEQLMAISIIAPELSQFSNIYDAIEMRTLFAFYVNMGKADFSVGYFQMKPSFIEEIEGIVQKNKILKKQYSGLIPKGSSKEKRRFRLNNLSTLSGQLHYLCLFVDIVKQKTFHMKFADDEEKLRYWATLYNCGLDLSPEEVKERQNIKQFPHFSKRFNYSDIAIEFYKMLQNDNIVIDMIDNNKTSPTVTASQSVADTWQNMKLR